MENFNALQLAFFALAYDSLNVLHAKHVGAGVVVKQEIELARKTGGVYSPETMIAIINNLQMTQTGELTALTGLTSAFKPYPTDEDGREWKIHFPCVLGTAESPKAAGHILITSYLDQFDIRAFVIPAAYAEWATDIELAEEMDLLQLYRASFFVLSLAKGSQLKIEIARRVGDDFKQAMAEFLLKVHALLTAKPSIALFGHQGMENTIDARNISMAATAKGISLLLQTSIEDREAQIAMIAKPAETTVQ